LTRYNAFVIMIVAIKAGFACQITAGKSKQQRGSRKTDAGAFAPVFLTP
jgi:hypothetical protein